MTLKSALALWLAIAPLVCARTFETGGHLKYRFQYAGYPSDSLYYPLTGDSASDHVLAFRYNLDVQKDRWDAEAEYQFQVLYGDSIEFTRELPESELIPPRIPSDRYRLFDLTRVFYDEGRTAVLNRLDRLSVGYTGDQGVVRFGRQAITWGNGLIYTPMDFFNPFDPAAIDKEYKTGDDMLYGQYLLPDGSDFQGAWVIRRDRAGNLTPAVDSIALKYHAFVGDAEFDLLVSRHYEDMILGAGAVTSLAGGILRGDFTVTWAGDETVFSAVANYSYSWTWWEKNVNGLAEIYYNGFGQPGGEYSPEELGRNPELLARLNRGELFTLGREYLALSAMIEMTPLWILTPNVFFNFSDGSALAQLVSQHDIAQDWQILGALNLPIGPEGTEFGGIEAGSDTVAGPAYLSTDWALTLQLAWYF